MHITAEMLFLNRLKALEFVCFFFLIHLNFFCSTLLMVVGTKKKNQSATAQTPLNISNLGFCTYAYAVTAELRCNEGRQGALLA